MDWHRLTSLLQIWASQSGLAQIKYKVQMCKNSPNLHNWKISAPTYAVSLFLTIFLSPFHASRTFSLFMSLMQVWQVKQVDIYNRRDRVFPPLTGIHHQPVTSSCLKANWCIVHSANHFSQTKPSSWENSQWDVVNNQQHRALIYQLNWLIMFLFSNSIVELEHLLISKTNGIS